MKQFIELMKQRYAFLRENPYILASWIQCCPDREIRDIYIDYLHEETPHPEYLIGFAKEAGIDPQNFLIANPSLSWARIPIIITGCRGDTSLRLRPGITLPA